MKIVLWIGNKPNQKALANKIHAIYPVSGIVVESRTTQTKITFDKIIEKLFLFPITNAWKNMQSFYDERYPSYPDTKLLEVTNINSDAAYQFTNDLKPDMIIVSGTGLVRSKMLSIQPAIGILNLHTGLSPYIKGGPNSTNWCIANNELHLIGNTIMWIDPGIDTGNIITTETTEFEGSEDLTGVHIKVMEHAHSLYLKAIDKLMNGKRNNVKQDTICAGTTYKTKQWGLKQKFALLINFRNFGKQIRSENYSKQKAKVITVEI